MHRPCGPGAQLSEHTRPVDRCRTYRLRGHTSRLWVPVRKRPLCRDMRGRGYILYRAIGREYKARRGQDQGKGSNAKARHSRCARKQRSCAERGRGNFRCRGYRIPRDTQGLTGRRGQGHEDSEQARRTDVSLPPCPARGPHGIWEQGAIP